MVKLAAFIFFLTPLWVMPLWVMGVLQQPSLPMQTKFMPPRVEMDEELRTNREPIVVRETVYKVVVRHTIWWKNNQQRTNHFIEESNIVSVITNHYVLP